MQLARLTLGGGQSIAFQQCGKQCRYLSKGELLADAAMRTKAEYQIGIAQFAIWPHAVDAKPCRLFPDAGIPQRRHCGDQQGRSCFNRVLLSIHHQAGVLRAIAPLPRRQRGVQPPCLKHDPTHSLAIAADRCLPRLCHGIGVLQQFQQHIAHRQHVGGNKSRRHAQQYRPNFFVGERFLRLKKHKSLDERIGLFR